MTITKQINNKSKGIYSSNYEWAKDVKQEDALNCFNRLSRSTLQLMTYNNIDASIASYHDLESLAKVYNSHLSDNKAFYYGNNKVVNYLNDLQSQVIDIVAYTDKQQYEIFLSNKSKNN
ncbi:hypothetical protein CIL05_06975 [Virgibacillus profundi]|uniref:Uncharacterized protein n=1 Tax=Virgibacillus profundi TaxID=2024555 RepID=A0A2A2IF66_9BACI|nr:hypothetical protein [Virgibacillus profundi]PAV30202.1 hypothetical protein CIL05_06975 [Virgibacillus profundi]PXY54374.1 hypothetical protein CIT14_07060 [Virgibacillus profundi]